MLQVLLLLLVALATCQQPAPGICRLRPHMSGPAAAPGMPALDGHMQLPWLLKRVPGDGCLLWVWCQQRQGPQLQVTPSAVGAQAAKDLQLREALLAVQASLAFKRAYLVLLLQHQTPLQLLMLPLLLAAAGAVLLQEQQVLLPHTGRWMRAC